VEGAVDLRALSDRLQAQEGALVWLDSARAHPVTGRYSVLAWEPWLTFTATGTAVSISTSASTKRLTGDPLRALQRVLKAYPGPERSSSEAALPPMGVGWCVLLSYELNRWIERLPTPIDQGIVPEMAVYGMRLLVIVDHERGRSWLMSVVDPHQPLRAAVARARERLEALQSSLQGLRSDPDIEPAAPIPLRSWCHPERSRGTAEEAGPVRIEPAMSQAQFERMVHEALEAIRAGEIFQVNLAQRFEAAWEGSAWSVYDALRRINPSPFACLWQDQQWALVSCSPERLVRVRDGVAEARPIAGTRPRGTDPQEDLINSLELLLSEKERAEHIMLVDLARNDLGRICRAGSVRVDELMTLEDYSHVIHIVSNVCGRIVPETDPVAVIRALFPGGTITGCPKVRAMELIRELEPVARGPYTGSVGWIGFDGSLDLNILIRTLVATSGRVSFHVGAGIVADSVPEREYRETLDKGRALLAALQAARAMEGRRDAVRYH